MHHSFDSTGSKLPLVIVLIGFWWCSFFMVANGLPVANGNRSQNRLARQADQDQPFEGDAIMIEPLETATNFPIDDDSTGNLTQRFGYGFHHGSFHQGWYPPPQGPNYYANPYSPYGSYGPNYNYPSTTAPSNATSSYYYYNNGYYYPATTTTTTARTTTTSTRSPYGNYYAFYFRDGSALNKTDSLTSTDDFMNNNQQSQDFNFGNR